MSHVLSIECKSKHILKYYVVAVITYFTKESLNVLDSSSSKQNRCQNSKKINKHVWLLLTSTINVEYML